jgi:hypothetical protein
LGRRTVWHDYQVRDIGKDVIYVRSIGHTVNQDQQPLDREQTL